MKTKFHFDCKMFSDKIHHRLAFRFVDVNTEVKDFDKNSNNIILKPNLYPMILVPIIDQDKQVQGVQRIILNNKGAKQGKFTLGALKNNAGLIQDGPTGQILVIAEGPETAASIATIFKGTLKVN